MPTYLVKGGRHYHRMPPFSTLPWIGAQSMRRTVTFGESCQYDSAAYNSEDVNKLFGLSFGFGSVHHNSARFGWRWSKADQCIELLAYVYNEGKRNQDEQLRFPVVAQVPLAQSVRCEIAAALEFVAGKNVPVYTFLTEGVGVSSLTAVPRNEVPSYGLTHGLYFGGSQPAPHDIHVTIDRHGN